MTHDGTIAVKEEIKNTFLKTIDISNYSNQPEVQNRLNNTLQNIIENKTISDIYNDSLVEVPMSQSNFLSQCVQFTEHWTPHRKLKQALIELKSKYSALHTAKNNHFKAFNKYNRLYREIENINTIIHDLQTDKTMNNRKAMKISCIKQSIISPMITNYLEKYDVIDDLAVIDMVIEKLKEHCSELFIKLQESEYSIKDTDHMVKDALDTASMYESAVEKYKQEVQESSLSYEESEMYYYVMFLTWEAENQFRTGDHQLDRGTSKVITQMPNGLRRKVYENINLLKQKYFKDNQPVDGDFLIKSNPELFEPIKTGDMEFEGEQITNFLGVAPIKQLVELENK